MTDKPCDEMRLLIQADIDGELQPAEAAAVSGHLERCPDCADMEARLIALSGRLRQDLPTYRAPARLRAAVEAAVALPAAPPERRRTFAPGLYFAAGLALAACLALFTLLPGSGDLPDSVVAAHIRALQPGHLMDVVSTDQHTVKPWFDGRLPFAPPVKDLAAEGFPLAGGRLDYIAGHTAAALIYHRRQHVIDLFAWPSDETLDHEPGSGTHDGYNFLRWRQDGMTFWAVSDVSAEELADFVARWRKDG